MRNQFRCGLILFAVFLFAQTNVVKSSNVVYCYWGTWSHYRPGDGNFEADNIDPNLCTHIGYAFFGLKNDEIVSLDSFLDFDLDNIAKTVALKQLNPNLKVLASIGGWNEGSTTYSAMASNVARRTTFINSVIKLLQQYEFDGLDLDWEYPTQRGGSESDRQNFVALLKELKAAFEALGLLLTVAVAAGEGIASISYDIPNISKHVDLINVMTYDFAGAWEATAGLNTPLQGAPKKDVKSSIEYWLKNGAPANKLVMGMAMYGRSFTLANSTQNTVGSPIIGAGNPGPITQEASYLGYNEICQFLKNGWTRRWDSAHLVPYAFKGNQWVGYDDKESLKYKIDYIKSLNLAGGMIWSIETDDFRGNCGETYPLLKLIKNGLSGNSTGTTTTTTHKPGSTTTTVAPTTISPNTIDCQQDGRFVHPTDCIRFYECHNGNRYDFSCPAGLYFDQESGNCNWPDQVNCKA